MRNRLINILVLLLVCTVAAISVPLAIRFASSNQESMFLDRLQDTNRFASVAEQDMDAVDGQALQDQVTRYQQIFGVAVAVIDRGMTVLQSAGHPDLSDPAVARAVSLALSGHESSDPGIVWPATERVMAVAVPIMRGDDVIGAALTVSSTARLREVLGTDLQLLLLADLAAIALFVLVAYRLASWVLQPVYELDEAIGLIRSGDLGIRAPVQRGPVEIRALAGSFNRMLDEVQGAMDSQRAFVANASHQLRNPLTALTLRLESLEPDLEFDQQRELNEILIETARLNAVLNQLLELATVQGGLVASPGHVDVAALTRDRANAWRPQAQVRAVWIDLSLPPTAVAYIDPALASSILDALLDNAIKFSPADARIAIRVVETGDGLCVEITDEGPGIDVTELEHLGDRFWRSTATQDVPGSGLGLSIALELASAIGATLRFAPAPSHGLQVVLRLPTCPLGRACPPGQTCTGGRDRPAAGTGSDVARAAPEPERSNGATG